MKLILKLLLFFLIFNFYWNIGNNIQNRTEAEDIYEYALIKSKPIGKAKSIPSILSRIPP